MAGSGKRPHAPRARGAEARTAAGSFARDVEQGPAGPRVGAFFDFDRTLIAGFSAVAFLGGWLASGRMGPLGFARTLAATARFRAGNIGLSALVAETASFPVAIAPEGTRSPTPRMGRFKKGAFHLAMRARVPIVPVVFVNALDALPNHGLVNRPSTVRVVAYPPISTDGWTASDLPERIAAVRELFVETLGDAAD